MASFDYRLNPLYTIKECSSCGALYTTDYCCSKGGLVDKIVRDPNKTPDSSQRPPQNCARCGNPVDGPYCRGCALLRKKFKEDLFTYCVENGIFQDLQDTSESSNDNTNVVNAPQEPFVVKQDPGENSSQSPPHIDHNCCYECGDSLDGIFCQRCTCKSCGKGAHHGYNCPPKVPIISNPEPCNNQTIDELPQTLPSFDPTCYSGDGNSFTYDSTPNFVNDSPNVFNPPPQPQYVPYSCELCGNDAHHGYDCPPQVPFVISLAWETISEIERAFEDKQYQPEGILKLFRKLHDDVQNIHKELAEYINTPNWNRPIVYYDDDDDEDYTIAITPVLSTEEPVDSLIIEDEHLDTIPAMESDEVIKSSVEILVPIPSESKGIPDKMCDVPFHDNSPPLDILKDQFEDFFDSNDDSTSSDDDSFSIDDIEYVEASPPDSELVSLEVVEIVIPEVGGIDTDILLTIKDDILREKLLNVNLLIAKIEALKDNPTPSSDFVTKSSSTFLNFFLEETNTFDNSLPESETFCYNLEPDSGNFTMDVVEDIFENQTREPRVHVPNILPTHPTLHLDSDFTLSNEFSISFIRDLPFLVIGTFLPFSSKNEDNVFNPGILASNEEKSPHLLSHRGFKAFQLISESPMMIYGENIPILDVLISWIFEASRALGFYLRSLELQILSFIWEIQYPNLID
ncbi:hypothetical protein Tco_0365946 [Tanacetum coccineum]